MATRVVLGVDFGSTTAKAILADARGALIGRASVAQRVERGAGGTAEQDPEGWWRDLRTLIRDTLGRPVASRNLELAGIAISGHLPTLVLLDGAGDLLGPAMLYADRRADGFIERARELSGQHLGGDELLPKLLWLAANDPERLRAARSLFNLSDYLVHRLTGVRALDHRTAMRSALFDPITVEWRVGLVSDLGLDFVALPPLVRGGEIAGHALPAPAADIGIPAGTPVLVGLGDTPATLLGAGVVRAGEAMVYYGTTTTLDVCTHDFEAYLADPRPIRDWAPYREVGYAVLGPAMVWAANGLAPAGDKGVDLGALDEAAADLPPDVNAPFVVPAFDAHASDGRAAPSAIVGLQPSDGRAALHRAMLESFAFVARAGLEQSGLAATTHRFVATGGGARSALWRQLVTDTLGAPQAWAPRSDASFGMAMLAARTVFGADVFGKDLPAWQGDVEITAVDPERRALQDARYARWLRIRAALGDTGQ